MKIEISAGGVVFKKKGKNFYILLLKDKNNNWTFPKGLIEDKEEKIKTAQREIEEETGLKKIKFKEELGSINYWYKLRDDLIKKTVYYFLFESLEDEITKPQIEEGIKEVVWFKPEEALKNIGYRKTNKPILEKVLKRLLNEG